MSQGGRRRRRIYFQTFPSAIYPAQAPWEISVIFSNFGVTLLHNILVQWLKYKLSLFLKVQFRSKFKFS